MGVYADTSNLCCTGICLNGIKKKHKILFGFMALYSASPKRPG
jgi:hypothetical protein